MGDTRCAAGCKMGIKDGVSCGACGGTGVAHIGMPDSRPPADRFADPRGLVGSHGRALDSYAPKRLMCGAAYNSWICTEPSGHEGRHRGTSGMQWGPR